MSILLKKSIKLYWERGYGEWENQNRACGSKLLFLNISWVMVVGVFQSKLTGSGIWKSVLFVQVEFAHWMRYRVHDGLQVKFLER